MYETSLVSRYRRCMNMMAVILQANMLIAATKVKPLINSQITDKDKIGNVPGSRL